MTSKTFPFDDLSGFKVVHFAGDPHHAQFELPKLTYRGGKPDHRMMGDGWYRGRNGKKRKPIRVMMNVAFWRKKSPQSYRDIKNLQQPDLL